MAKITLSTKVEPELKAKLEYIANGSGFSVSEHVKAALGVYILKYEKEGGDIPQAVIDRRAAELRERTR